MKLAIMQPYFLPYIGYYQLISSADLFVVYDNIKYTKKGWINRNRMLLNKADAIFSLPLKKGSDTLMVCERELSHDFNRSKLLSQFRGGYSKAPYFSQVFPLLEDIVHCPSNSLFEYIYNSIVRMCDYLDIHTKIVVSSEIPIDHELKSQDKVLALCSALGATCYINSIGGQELYDSDAFTNRGVDLKFIEATPFEYAQYEDPFVPWLSIVDVLMFNPLDLVRERVISKYEFV